jgi:hypothetical protein
LVYNNGRRSDVCAVELNHQHHRAMTEDPKWATMFSQTIAFP